jgi:hypothetical protein
MYNLYMVLDSGLANFLDIFNQNFSYKNTRYHILNGARILKISELNNTQKFTVYNHIFRNSLYDMDARKKFSHLLVNFGSTQFVQLVNNFTNLGTGNVVMTIITFGLTHTPKYFLYKNSGIREVVWNVPISQMDLLGRQLQQFITAIPTYFQFYGITSLSELKNTGFDIYITNFFDEFIRGAKVARRLTIINAKTYEHVAENSSMIVDFLLNAVNIDEGEKHKYAKNLATIVKIIGNDVHVIHLPNNPTLVIQVLNVSNIAQVEELIVRETY